MYESYVMKMSPSDLVLTLGRRSSLPPVVKVALIPVLVTQKSDKKSALYNGNLELPLYDEAMYNECVPDLDRASDRFRRLTKEGFQTWQNARLTRTNQSVTVRTNRAARRASAASAYGITGGWVSCRLVSSPTTWNRPSTGA